MCCKGGERRRGAGPELKVTNSLPSLSILSGRRRKREKKGFPSTEQEKGNKELKGSSFSQETAGVHTYLRCVLYAYFPPVCRENCVQF